MVAINAHYDGRVIVPDERVDLPPNQALIVRIEAKNVDEPPTRESALAWLVPNARDSTDVPLTCRTSTITICTAHPRGVFERICDLVRRHFILDRYLPKVGPVSPPGVRPEQLPDPRKCIYSHTEAVLWEWVNALANSATRRATAEGYRRCHQDMQIEVVIPNNDSSR